MAAPTAYELATRLLRILGSTARDGTGAFPIQSGDLDDIAGVMTAALQELVACGPQELRNRDSGAYLNPPTAVTVNCVNGSKTVVINGFATWMLGCTIQIAGQYQNEINSATELSQPYVGTTGTMGATVWSDCVQLGEEICQVLPLVQIPPSYPLVACDTREGFAYISGYPLVTDAGGGPVSTPLWSYFQKAAGLPIAWFLDSYYDATKTFLPRRLRLGPMPGQAFSLAFRVGLNPIRITVTDISTPDPGTPIPIPDTWVESLYYPICVKRMSALPQFRNATMMPEVDRQYRQAIRGMQTMGFGQGTVQQGIYI